MRQLIVSDPATFTELLFPSLPTSISVTHGVEETTLAVDDYGSVSWPSGRSPTTISFSGTFFGAPRAGAAWLPYWRDPAGIIVQLQLWHDEQYLYRRMLHLVLTESTLSMDVYMSAFTHELKGAFGDIGYQLDFKEWRPAVVGVDAPAASSPGVGVTEGMVPATTDEGDPETPDISSTYTVKPGDYLIKIAKQQLGNSGLWRDIYDLNIDTIGGDPDLIHPGMVLTLPGGEPTSAPVELAEVEVG